MHVYLTNTMTRPQKTLLIIYKRYIIYVYKSLQEKTEPKTIGNTVSFIYRLIYYKENPFIEIQHVFGRTMCTVVDPWSFPNFEFL